MAGESTRQAYEQARIAKPTQPRVDPEVKKPPLEEKSLPGRCTTTIGPAVAPENVPLRQKQIMGLQRSVGNQAVGRLLQRDKLTDLESRTKVLEKKTEAMNLDLKYRGEFGEKTANYKRIVYRLTGAFQNAIGGFTGAQNQQAAQDAVIDQVAATSILTAGAAALEPFLMFSLGKLKPVLDKVSTKISQVTTKDIVEKLENPINVTGSGTGNAITTARQGDRAAANQPPPGAGPGVPAKGNDPLTFLAGNLETIEKHAQAFEQAFSARANKFNALTPEEWEKWDKGAQEKIYQDLLAELNKMALGDADKREEPQTLAEKIELYLWAGWIKTHVPGVKGLQIGSKLATRLKAVGVESLAGVRFDTTSWIFMDHQPKAWEDHLRNWANNWSQKITKG